MDKDYGFPSGGEGRALWRDERTAVRNSRRGQYGDGTCPVLHLWADLSASPPSKL